MLLALLFGKVTKSRMVVRFFVLIAPVIPLLLIGVAIGLVNVDLMSDGIKGVFDFKGDSSNIERRLQFYSILDSVSESPFLGSGAGAVAGYVRNPYMPWAYELHYLSVLFHFGLVSLFLYALGCLAVLGGVVLYWRHASRMGNVRSAIASASLLAGVIGFLVGAGTNPYLAKFDYMWVIFLPFSIFSAYKADLGRKVGAR
jgi:O-antigen ligase